MMGEDIVRVGGALEEEEEEDEGEEGVCLWRKLETRRATEKEEEEGEVTESLPSHRLFASE